MHHPLLRRQLRHRLGDRLPDDPALQQLLEDIDAAYHEADRGPGMLERSLDLTSTELLERNQALHEAMSGGDIAIWTVTVDGLSIELRGAPLPFVQDPHGSVVVPIAAFLAVVDPADRDRVGLALDGQTDRERVDLQCWIADDRGRRRLELRGRRATGRARFTGVCTEVTHHEATQRRRIVDEQQQTLVRLAKTMASAPSDLEATFEILSQEVAATLKVARVGIWIHDRARDALVAASIHDRGRSERGVVLPLAPYRDYERALATNRVIAADDAHHHPATRAFSADYLTPLGIGAMLDATIFIGDQVVGVVCSEHVGPARRWTAEEQAFAAAVADLAAVFFEGHRRHAAEAALADQQRLLRSVIDTAPNLIFVKDRGGRFTLVNRAVAEIYGCTVDDLVGKTDRDCNANIEEVERFRRDDTEVLDTLVERFIPEEPLTGASGDTRWLQTVKRPLVGIDGKAEMVLGVSTDITERKRAEQERVRLAQKFQQSQQLESLGLLAGGVAHDFNNLLTPILVYVDLLQEMLPDGDSASELMQYLDEIRAAGLQARDLTAQLLAFGRRQSLVITSVDLNKEIDQLRSLLVRVLPEHIEIVTDLAADLPPVGADRAQVHQILMNLALNARDAMPTGGRLRFATAREPGNGNGNGDGNGNDEAVVLTVSDTGHGMDRATMGQIFEPFFTTKALGHGSGLGLATVYGVVQQHRGTIDVESSPGAGTTFIVRLPPAAPHHASPNAVSSPMRSVRATVLVVEDDPRVLRLVCTLLGRHQIDVLAAHSPERALELARAAPHVDLLLSDVIPLLDSAGTPAFLLGISEDITERRATEEERTRLIDIIESTSDMVGFGTADGRVRYINRAGRRMLGIPLDEDLTATTFPQYLSPWAVKILQQEAMPGAARDEVWEGESALLARSGREIPCSQVVTAHKDSHGTVAYFSTIMRDITDLKKSELVLEQRVEAEIQARKQTEQLLLQAQKMEGIGRLAGGVAHDFNNLLSVILSYSEMIQSDLKEGDPLRADVEEIRKAGSRAADLTRQLLAFSRQQVLQPRIVDLNETTASMRNMIGRLVGEDVDVQLTTAATGRVKCDPGQMEQVVMNLVVNARDAMPDGGTLTIETADVVLDEAFARKHVGATAGPHVMLAVSDTGVGIEAGNVSRIFEPFFTTKEKGKGTGLGLSTVYGIVRQSSGCLSVDSDPGQGTTFRVYLPRTAAVEDESQPGPPPARRRGSETVLLVEDEPQLRALARGILQRRGYRVLEAQNGGEALLLCEQHTATIHLLLTDVVMPQMNGRQLAERLGTLRPEMRVLYVSGYTDDVILRHGVLEKNVAFLPKPFTPDVLAGKVREVLDAPPGRFTTRPG